MPTYVQADRPMTVTTPLGKDALLLVGFTGHETISQLFSFQLDLLAENETEVSFEKLLGQKITVDLALPDGGSRYFSGICNRMSQGERDFTFTAYRMDLIPQFWLLTRRAQSRIFQHLTVPDILKKVLQGLDVTYEIQGTFHPRDYCVQYRETDFNFASRVMEEEGIYYFFKHASNGHTMVVANTPQSHLDVAGPSRVRYEELGGGTREDDRVSDWEKFQELRSGKYTLWDHCFELPHKHLEADKTILPSVAAGKITHRLQVGGSEKLELYDYPGEYAQRFDGVDRGGGDQPGDLQKIHQDNKRTVGIRMEEEAVSGLLIRGGSNCRQFVAGHKFTLEKHFNADGQYVLTGVAHAARYGGYRTEQAEFTYHNTFTCIPLALPFRPLRTTPRPFVQGTQTAVVVGPSGEEIFTDKYSRVKVQFHWDREGKNDANSSCWVRVGTLWAGKQWGVIHIPRIGQEVIVAFQEGDPDQPIIVGSVYNAEMMPPYKLPDKKTQSGVKSRSSKNGGPENFNELRFEDKKGEEEVYFHAERNLTTVVEKDESRDVGNDRTTTIGHDDTLTVQNNRKATIMMDDEETVGKNQTCTVGMSRSTTIGMSDSLTVGATISVTAGGAVTITAPMITLSAPMVVVSGMLMVGTAIISPVYSPGIGNLI